MGMFNGKSKFWVWIGWLLSTGIYFSWLGLDEMVIAFVLMMFIYIVFIEKVKVW